MKKLLHHLCLLLCSTGLFSQANLTLNTVRTSGGAETACPVSYTHLTLPTT